MPQVGQDIPKARIMEWHVGIGDKVEESDLLATVESEKAVFEVEAFAEGTVLRILFSEGEEAEVLKPIAYIGEPGEEIPEEKGTAPPAEVAEDSGSGVESSQQGGHPVGYSGNPDKLLISPSARRFAMKHGIDLNEVKGSGPGGRIVKQDIEAMLGAGGDKVIRFGNARKTIAERLAYSKQNIPHYYLFLEIDFSAAMKWRKEVNEREGAGISVNDILIRASARALSEFPAMNSHVDNEKMTLKADINIGVAVSAPDGILVPIIPGADKLDIRQISEVSGKNAENARRRVMNPGPAGTFTVSNLGMFGIDRFLPIINPPECAILSAGKVKKKLVPGEDGVRTIESMTLGLACDHRAVDGAEASRFLDRIREIIENYEE
jgi:pyruvate dehydrogenase E2 component (dihydrolipoamide acetyltransferase)